ncbi:hypothetical protein MLD38_023209 [Melastoma candidum]|uniref:Uncharacterized protein n=1 Tax=Melastoma candidum TaxID=119954 RepID=A0ACB9QQ92_9MYRT|nr:hypothetical protein MLD38_023209 [Melastoma candidum]
MGCLEPVLFLAFMLATAASPALGQADGLSVGFYSTNCSMAEEIVTQTVRDHFKKNSAIAPKLLRLHFHDCFVQGCEGSILIDGNDTEKTAIPNLSLELAFPVIDDAKARLEAECPGVVSCADIVALAARDAVVLTKGLSWTVWTGRRDGNVSSAFDTFVLPSPFDSIDTQKQTFSDLGLDTKDLVTLVGGHTIGTTACQFFSDRLYDFNNTNGTSDPAINSHFLPKLEKLCPQNGDGTNRVVLDWGSGNRFDLSYFFNLGKGQAILDSDEALWADNSTREVVEGYLGNGGLSGLIFDIEFGNSMVKMGNIGVLTGNNGDIRKVCSSFN